MDEIKKFLEERSHYIMDEYNLEEIGAEYFKDVPGLIGKEASEKFNTQCIGTYIKSCESWRWELHIFNYSYLDKENNLKVLNINFEQDI